MDPKTAVAAAAAAVNFTAADLSQILLLLLSLRPFLQRHNHLRSLVYRSYENSTQTVFGGGRHAPVRGFVADG